MIEQKNIELAREYLRERLDAETSMTNNLTRKLIDAANKIVDKAYSYNIIPSLFSFTYDSRLKAEIDNVIYELRETIEDYTETLAVASHEDDRDDIVAYVFRESHGKTFKQREKEYTDRFSKEVEVAIAAGLVLGKDKNTVKDSILMNHKHPYDNPIIKEAEKLNHAILYRLDATPSFGVGRTVSSWTALDDLATFAVAEGWMYHFIRRETDKGAIAFASFRGSSYPCSQCDDETTYVHTLEHPLPPYHMHCRCYIVPIYIL